MTAFFNLPSEIKKFIFHFAIDNTPSTAKSLPLVCKEWNTLTKDIRDKLIVYKILKELKDYREYMARPARKAYFPNKQTLPKKNLTKADIQIVIKKLVSMADEQNNVYAKLALGKLYGINVLQNYLDKAERLLFKTLASILELTNTQNLGREYLEDIEDQSTESKALLAQLTTNYKNSLNQPKLM